MKHVSGSRLTQPTQPTKQASLRNVSWDHELADARSSVGPSIQEALAFFDAWNQILRRLLAIEWHSVRLLLSEVDDARLAEWMQQALRLYRKVGCLEGSEELVRLTVLGRCVATAILSDGD